MIDEPKSRVPEIWSFLWRGVVGGLLGLVALFVYRLYTDPYLLGGGLLPTGALIAGGNGLLVGAVIRLSSGLVGRDLRVVSRVILGTFFSFYSMALYSYLDGAFLYSDFKAFITDSLVVGLMLGAPAGAMAKPMWRNY